MKRLLLFSLMHLFQTDVKDYYKLLRLIVEYCCSQVQDLLEDGRDDSFQLRRQAFLQPRADQVLRPQAGADLRRPQLVGQVPEVGGAQVGAYQD